MFDYPYPTHIEVIRTFAKVLGIKAGDKKLDDTARDRLADYRLTDELYCELNTKIQKFFRDKIIGKVVESNFSCYLKSYNGYVSTVSAEGLSRSEMKAALSKTLLCTQITNSLKQILESFSGKTPSLVSFFSATTSCTSQVISWLNEHDTGWSSFYSSLNKENKAKVKAWHDSEHTPDIQSLTLLRGWSEHSQLENIDWEKIKVLLFIASTIDRVVREDGASLLIEECRLQALGAKPIKNFSQEVKSYQKVYDCKITLLSPLIKEIENALNPNIKKSNIQLEKCRSLIEDLETKLDENKVHFNYRLLWFKAKLNVLNGEISNANKLYKSAIEESFFRSGISQKALIEEAIVIAASIDKPDKVFLRHLKNALLKFKYDIPSVPKNKSSAKFSDLVEGWEIELWKSDFFKRFPKRGMFPNSKEPSVNAKVGPIISNKNTEIKPDFKRPNKKIKVGENWEKPYPQLVWFTMQLQNGIVKKLLKKGADVNQLSNSNDSAILMAVEALNPTTCPINYSDDTLFKLLAKYPHKAEVINQATEKKRLLPLISAIESGRLYIVKQLLDMGANVNQRGLTDWQTPLNVAVKMIGRCKDPEKYKKEMANIPMSPEHLDAVRRHSNGMLGTSLKDQEESMQKLTLSPEKQMIYESLQRVMEESFLSHIKLSEMREIAELLIESGADVNAEHNAPIKGYTPLMLAAEIDEADLFNKMLKHGGNPRKTYFHEFPPFNIDCFIIAECFKSSNVLNALKDVNSLLPEEGKHAE